MKLSKWTLGLLLTLGGFTANAAIGNEAGGGGSRLESAFRLTAADLIARLKDYPTAQSLCPSDLMQKSLDRTKILIVNTLTDLNTGKPITDVKLDAWTRPGTMQLKEQVWSQYIDGNGRYLDMSVSALILHEVYRSTSVCDDDKGGLSTAVVRLLSQRGANGQKLNKLFTMKYAISIPSEYTFGLNIRFMGAMCEAPVNLAKPTSNVVCAAYGSAGYERTVVVIFKTDVRGARYTKALIKKFALPNAGIGPIYGNIVNAASFVSPEMPFYWLYDINTGYLWFGMALDRLTGVLTDN